MQITFSLLALAIAATAMAVVPAPLEVRAATTCDTVDGKGVCLAVNAACNGFIALDSCPGSTVCCVPTDDDTTTSEDGDEGAEGPDDGSGDLSNAEADAGADADAEAEVDAEAEADPKLDQRSLKSRKLTGTDIYSWARKQLGVKYVFGQGNCSGPTKGGFDCSGLTLYAVCRASGRKIQLPHNAQAQYKDKRGKHLKCADKKCSNAKKGDLIFWGRNGNCKTGIKHVAIFVSKGKMIVAPTTGSKVKISNIWPASGSLKICPSVVRFW